MLGVSPRVAKHASDKRETCPSSHLMSLAETKNASVFPRDICVSLDTNLVARYKVSEVGKLEDTEGTSMSRATCLLV